MNYCNKKSRLVANVLESRELQQHEQLPLCWLVQNLPFLMCHFCQWKSSFKIFLLVLARHNQWCLLSGVTDSHFHQYRHLCHISCMSTSPFPCYNKCEPIHFRPISWRLSFSLMPCVTVTFLLCFTLYLREISRYKPLGAYIMQGADLTEGALHYKFGGLIVTVWLCYDLPVKNAIANLASMLNGNSKAFPVN